MSGKIAQTFDTYGGEFVIRMQYINPNPRALDSDYEPAIVICRPKKVQSRCAWVILLSAAWKYVDPTTETQHSEYMRTAAYKIAEMLGLGNSKHAAYKIAEAILDHLEDLINMPPVFQPKHQIGEATANIGGLNVTVPLEEVTKH